MDMTDTARRLIAEYCRTGTRNPADRLRSLIRVGLRTGRIPPLQGINFSDAPVVNGILENFKPLGFFDFSFLRSIRSHIIRSTCNETDGLRFMMNISRLGFHDEELVTQILTGLIRNESLKKLSPHDSSELISILSHQRIRNSSLVRDVVDRTYDMMNVPDQVRTILSISSLRLPLDGIHLPVVPDDSEAGLDLLTAIVLSPGLMDDHSVVTSHFLPTFERLSHKLNILCKKMDNLDQRDRKIIHGMSLIWYALNFGYPAHYNLLSSPCKQMVAIAAEGLQKSHIREGSGLVNGVSKQLFAMNVRHNTCVDKGPFNLDIEEVGENVIWECDKPIRFYRGVDGGIKTSYYMLRDRILKAMGYKVVHIPYWHWSRLSNNKARADYCRMSRFLAVSDTRESPADGVLRLSGSLYEGEFFFKKQQPKKSWSWHGHSTCPVRVSL